MKILAFMRCSYRSMIGLLLVLALSVVGAIALRDGDPRRSDGDVVRGEGSATELEQLRVNLLAIFKDCESLAPISRHPGSEAKCRAVWEQVQAMSQEALEPYARVAGPIEALRVASARLTDSLSSVASYWSTNLASAAPRPTDDFPTDFPQADYPGAVGIGVPYPNASDSVPGTCSNTGLFCLNSFSNTFDLSKPCSPQSDVSGASGCSLLFPTETCQEVTGFPCTVRGNECGETGEGVPFCVADDGSIEGLVNPPRPSGIIKTCSFECVGDGTPDGGCGGTCDASTCSNNGSDCTEAADCNEAAGTRLPFYNDSADVFTALTAKNLANIVFASAHLACEESILGFDGSAFCIPLEIAAAVFDTIFDELTFCDDENIGAEINAIYARTLHLHQDLEKVQTTVDIVQTTVDTVQTTLDTTTEMKRVHLQVIEVEEKRRFLLGTTEAGEPVDVTLIRVQTSEGATNNPAAFTDVTTSTASVMATTGVLDVEINQNNADAQKSKIFQFQVMHEHADDSFTHYGTIIVDRIEGNNLGAGQ